MRTALIACAAALSACAAGPAPVSYDALKTSIVVRDMAGGGGRAASSVQAAQTEGRPVALNAPEMRRTMSVYAEKRPGQPAEVAIMMSEAVPIFETEVSNVRPVTDADRFEKAFVGGRLQEVRLEMLERSGGCNRTGDGIWCARITHYRIQLPVDLVRELAAPAAREDIPVALGTRMHIQQRVPKAELVATLDALGVLSEFQ
jgi:hypothetical protein